MYILFPGAGAATYFFLVVNFFSYFLDKNLSNGCHVGCNTIKPVFPIRLYQNQPAQLQRLARIVHCDSSFENPQHMFWIRNKKIIFLFHTLN